MADSIATVVNWYGPYTDEGTTDAVTVAFQAASKHWDDGLYMAVGPGEVIRRGPRQTLYVGVGEPLCGRLNAYHHRLKDLHVSELWLGEVGVPRIPGRKTKRIDAHLDSVEWATAFFMELPFNYKKRGKPPQVSCVVTNRWFATDFDTPIGKPVKTWPDIIEYDYYREAANLVWFSPEPRIKPVHIDQVKRQGSVKGRCIE